MSRRVAALVVVAGVLLAFAPAAHAVTCDTQTLTDADGVTWAFDDNADAKLANRLGMSDGGNVYFDESYTVFYSVPGGGECSFEDDGRELVFPEDAVAGLQVSTKVFVPSGSPASSGISGCSGTPAARPWPSTCTASPASRRTMRRRTC